MVISKRIACIVRKASNNLRFILGIFWNSGFGSFRFLCMAYVQYFRLLCNFDYMESLIHYTLVPLKKSQIIFLNTLILNYILLYQIQLPCYLRSNGAKLVDLCNLHNVCIVAIDRLHFKYVEHSSHRCSTCHDNLFYMPVHFIKAYF